MGVVLLFLVSLISVTMGQVRIVHPGMAGTNLLVLEGLKDGLWKYLLPHGSTSLAFKLNDARFKMQTESKSGVFCFQADQELSEAYTAENVKLKWLSETNHNYDGLHETVRFEEMFPDIANYMGKIAKLANEGHIWLSVDCGGIFFINLKDGRVQKGDDGQGGVDVKKNWHAALKRGGAGKLWKFGDQFMRGRVARQSVAAEWRGYARQSASKPNTAVIEPQHYDVVAKAWVHGKPFLLGNEAILLDIASQKIAPLSAEDIKMDRQMEQRLHDVPNAHEEYEDYYAYGHGDYGDYENYDEYEGYGEDAGY